MSQPNLHIIDITYGKTADLYTDVLRVPPSSTPEQIQQAFFDRRTMLFKNNAPTKQIDAVVMAGRILGEPALRKAYDHIRPRRMQRESIKIIKKANDSTSVNTSSVNTSISSVNSEQQRILDIVRSTSPTWRFTARDFERMPSDELEAAADKVLKPRVVSPNNATGSSSITSDTTSTASRRLVYARRRDEEAEVDAAEMSAAKAPRPLSPPLITITGSTMTKSGSNLSLGSGRRVVSPTVSIQDRAKIEVSAKRQASKRRLRNAKMPFDDSSDIEEEKKDNGSNYSTDLVAKSSSRDLVDLSSSKMLSDETSETVVSIEEEDDDDDETATILSTRNSSDGWFANATNELYYFMDDTKRSIDQIVNVFTLDDKDISAVCGRIEKAKKQIGMN